MAVESTQTQGPITAEEALTLSLNEMESGSGLPFQRGLREKVAYKARKNFEEHHDQWATFKDKVLRSARQIGRFAEEFARFEAEINGLPPATEIKEHHADEAIRVVKTICPAGFRIGVRFRWCPDA